MKTPLNWLAEYVDIKGLGPEKISDGLRMSGTENVLEKGQSLLNVVVGEIKEITKHPNADKLQVAQVDVGGAHSVISSEAEKSLGKEDRSLRSSNDSVEMTKNGNDKKGIQKPIANSQKLDGELLTIVCGAPNIKVGQKVPVALVGAKFEDFEIKKAKIRDVESSGMLCAEDELGLGEDHTGIMILDKDAKVGQLFSEYLAGSRTSNNETVIDAELTPNRGDCLSMIGMAREVAATFDRKFKMPVIKKPEVTSKKKIEVEVLDKKLCPRYIAKVVEGVKIGPSPKWMQERLVAAGVRPISNLVDVTNYVMLELGQPLHAFDGSKINGKIIVRKAKKGEKIVTLDSVSRSLTTDDLLICDSKKPVALAGVMGGLNSEVDDKTTIVVLEAAVFDSTSIRKTAQRLNLRSEASNRFEKGIPMQLPEIAIERAAELLIANSEKPEAGAVGPNTDVLSGWIWVQRVGLRLSRIKELLGVNIKEAETIRILDSLGIEAEKFDFKTEARKHVGKPYVFGASYKTYGEMAFDCSYLTDLIYSKIGKFIGYTSLAQYELGRPVKDDELCPGDILFIKGHIDKSATDHYFTPDGKGGYEKVNLKNPKKVGHNALYIGDGRIIHARQYDYDVKNKKWKKLSEGKVIEEDVAVFTDSPEYLGARRYISDPADYYAIVSPWWRRDIRIEEDILEELVRIYGYNKIPASLPSGTLPGAAQNERVVMESKLKNKLVAQGLTEVITYSFISEKLAKLSGADPGKLSKINNPLSQDQEYMRSALWPSVLEVMAKNQDYADELRVFEFANTYKEGGRSEELHFCAATRLANGKKSFFDLKGLVYSLLSEFNVDKISLKANDVRFAENGQGADIMVEKTVIGQVGVVNKKIAKQFGQKTDLAVVEMNLAKILPKFGRKIVFRVLPKYPRARRDVNIVVGAGLSVSEIEKTLAQISDKNIISYRVSDVYEGKPARPQQKSEGGGPARIGRGGLPNGKKSVTINIEIGSEDRTLKDEEINSSVGSVIGALTKIGGEIRS